MDCIVYMHDPYLASQKTDINENGSDIAQTNVNFTEMANDTIRPIVNVDSACVKMLIGNPIACTESKSYEQNYVSHSKLSSKSK